ncbi:hypothetical protein BBJ28_00023948 [Nothophytophthora sp. Chile5]|nr:hypothetical protein BBJ28_00023948 [Nothophytophthora sp. Chile5]
MVDGTSTRRKFVPLFQSTTGGTSHTEIRYFDTFRRASLPANLTQAQRDFFGGHTYQRTDREGYFRCAWSAAHHSIGDVSERIRGNL